MGRLVSKNEIAGARVGGYEIVQLIGHGATASVYEGRHVALGKPVAIKLLHEHFAADEQIRGRFLREGRVAASLRHPNIVDVLDVGTEGDLPYLVMELLTGSDLRALLADVGVLEVEQALAYLLPIASALAAAHGAKVLHRDLKPANIFLARDARDDVIPKLVDFGLSKAGEGDHTSSLTKGGIVAGTLLYMAPEQTFGVKNSTPASDQYALAAIAYEALTGQAPFEADGMYALLDAIRSDPIRPPSHIHGRVPEDLDDVLLRALARDPAKRFADVRSFGAALLRFADERTRATLGRDLSERLSGAGRAASRPSIRKAAALAETRIEDTTPSRRPSSSSFAAAEPAPSQRPSRRPSGSGLAASFVPGPLPCPAGTSPFRIKGMGYRGILHMIESRVTGGLDALAKHLGDDALIAFLRQPFLASSRYDIFPMLPLSAALARELGVPMNPLLDHAGRGQSRYDAKTVFRTMFSIDRVERIAETIHRFGAQYYDFGAFSGRLAGDHQIEIVHAGIPAYVHPWHAPMHLGYTLETARILGGKDVRVISSTTEDTGKAQGYPVVTVRTVIGWKD